MCYVISRVISCADDVDRLMVNLTQPARLCFQNHIPEDKITHNFYLQVEAHLQAYKEVRMTQM